MSRRISGNKGFVGQPLEDHDDDDEGPNNLNTSIHSGISRRRSLGGRRRSSFGSHSSKNASSSVDQTRIAEMYKNVIKMSSENKINNKNSWNFDLIDQMGSIIKSDSTGSRGVNFQKASFTLDASVDIYSHRVDDTHSSSQTMLRNLSNADREGGNGSEARGESRVGTKSASRKLNIANTIEANVSNINAAKIERVQSTDPMFLKMNKAFDDGGAKGMLMANLRVSSTECSLSFSSPEVPDTASSTAPATVAVSNYELVDISDLISRCGFDASSLMSMSVCPALTLYRETIGVQESLIGAFDLQDFTSTFPSASSPYSPPTVTDTDTESPAQLASASSTYISCSDFGCIDDDGDDNDNDVDADDFGIDSFADFAPVQSPQPGRKSVGTALNRRSSVNGTVHKIQWDSMPDQTQLPATPLKSRGDSLSGSALTSASAAPLVWDATGISCSNEYSFFDIDMINKSNNWAGARHWKYATRRQTALAVDPAEEVPTKEPGSTDSATDKAGIASKAAASKSKSAKKKFSLNPLSELLSEDLFAVPKSRTRGSDVTCLTAAALEKESAFEAEGGLFLPPDAKLQTRDLCRLMLCHNIIVPPPLLAHVFMKQAAASKTSTGKTHDVIWGQVRRDPTASSTGGFNPTMESADYDDHDDDDDDGGAYGEDFCDPDGDNTDDADVTDSIAAGMERGLHISSEGLLRATRTVDKIDIGFATVAKKVNVKRLKSDIWTRLSVLEERTSLGSSDSRKTSLTSEQTDGEGSETSRKRDRDSLGMEETSFQDLVCEISSGQRQKDVTLPFYFICLLHLANEKTLRIDGSPDMTDLFISKDS